jgi:hypothetical protein
MKATIEITIPAEYAGMSAEDLVSNLERVIEEHTKLRVWVTETSDPVSNV